MPSNSIKQLKPDWSNWSIFADMFKADLDANEWGAHIDPRSPIYLPPPGLPGTSEQHIYTTYTRIEGIVTRILFDSIPVSIYSQIAGEETFLKKWEKLKELHAAHTQQQTIPSAMVDNEAQMCVTDGGEEPSISYTEEKSIIIDCLKRCKYTPDMSLLAHLTHLKVLREGLVNRDAVLSDRDFLEYVKESFPPGSPYQYYVKAVTATMQRDEDQASFGASVGGNRTSKLDEVFNILFELEKQAKAAEARAREKAFADQF